MPRMPWYPRDFHASTRGWPLVARAVYRELLDMSWDIGGLPADPRRLRALIDATPSEWARAWPLVEPKFTAGPDDLLRNARLEHHRAEAIAKYEQARDAARKRWAP